MDGDRTAHALPELPYALDSLAVEEEHADGLVDLLHDIGT